MAIVAGIIGGAVGVASVILIGAGLWIQKKKEIPIKDDYPMASVSQRVSNYPRVSDIPPSWKCKSSKRAQKYERQDDVFSGEKSDPKSFRKDKLKLGRTESRFKAGLQKVRSDRVTEPKTEPIFENQYQKILDEIAHHPIPEVKWDDIYGQVKVKKMLYEIGVEPGMGSPSFFQNYPKTILMFGPNGVGKTLLAAGLANIAKGITIINLPPEVLFRKELDVIFLNEIFEFARINAPSLIFFDESDALFETRNRECSEKSIQVKNSLSTILNRVIRGDLKGKICIIAATNRPREFDSSFKVRFPHQFYIEMPDFEIRKQMIVKCLGNSKLTSTQRKILAEDVSRKTERYSHGNLQDLIQAANRVSQGSSLTLASFDIALQEVRPTNTQEVIAYFDDYEKNRN